MIYYNIIIYNIIRVRQAGRLLELRRGEPWWAAVDRLLWPEGMEADMAAAGVWDPDHGDRQQVRARAGWPDGPARAGRLASRRDDSE